MEFCPVCKRQHFEANSEIQNTHNAIVFIRTMYLPYMIRSEAREAIEREYSRGAEMVLAHVDCCFELKNAVDGLRSRTSSKPSLRVLGKPA